jgi:large repetitive protein
MRIKLLLTFTFLVFVFGSYSQCDPSVPIFNVNLTGSPSGTWTSPNVIRNGNCCGTTAPDRCIDFVITLDPGAVGISFNIISGAIPGGALFYQIGCGPPTPLGSPICLSGVGPHLLTFCKPGTNANVYQITSIPAATGGTNIIVNDGCIDTIHATGFNPTTVTWNSIYPGAPGAYNSYLSCTANCLNPIVTGSGTLPPYVDYVVCGQPAAMCNFATVCDTVRVVFNPTLHVTIAPINPTICFGQTSTTITATGSGGTPPYSYLWNSTNPSPSINVGAGTYNVVLSDASGCPPTSASVTVTSFSVAITANAGPDDTTCSQSPATILNGAITGASGGIWSGGAGTFSPSNTALNAVYTPTAAELAAGFVNLTLTSTGNGTCPAASDVVKIYFIGFTGTVAIAPVNVSCAGGNNGSATASVTGGIPPYTYSWNTVPVQTGATANNLVQGTYTVTITNGIGCTTQSSVTITQPTALAVSGVISNVSCFAGNNGTVTVTPSGGTPPYSYLWSPGGSTLATISGQTAGTYTVTVTDSKGCTLTSNYTITQPPLLVVAMTKTNVSCFAGNNGTATATASGGTPAYIYSWAPSGGTASTASGLTAGTYTVTVTDAKGCVTTNTVVITQPTALAATTTVTNETCDYLNNGTATANPSGGTPPYTYLWMPGSLSTATITNLSSGTYTLTVTDNKGCTVTAFATITQPPTLTVGMNQVNVSCFAGNNGSATASPSGGTPGYTYSWLPGGATTATASGLAAGTYTVTVTDANACQAQNTVTITQPLLPLSMSNVITNVSCSGGSNGTITVTPAGGTAPYTYLWSPGGQTTAGISGQTAGTYTVTVTDFKGCLLTANYTITQPAPLAISFTHTNVSCFNGSNGTANSTVTGGTPAYSYNWTPSGGTGPNATGLQAGTYTLTVTDSKGCVASNTVVITQPTVLTASTTVINETCDYLNNGSATANPSGGTPGYTYSWMPGSLTGATVSNLAAGTYTATVTDSKGCVVLATATISQPPPLSIAFSSQVNVSCFGGNNGSVSATPAGGTPNYSYSWMPGSATTNSISGLTAGTYTLTITDNNSCQVQNTVSITQPALPLSVSGSSVIVSCFGGSNGTATATGAGGTAPYTYSWMPGSLIGQNVSGLIAGTYTVTATDANGCTSTNTVVVNQPSPLAISFTKTNVSCFSASNGTATANVTGGTPAYSYSWAPLGGSGATASGLPAGTYTVTVTDSKGCIASNSVVITEPTALLASTSVTAETCDYLNNGTATANPSGGTPGYSYSWMPGSLTTPTITNLSSGTYTLTVTDALGCVVLATATITQPAPLAIAFNAQTNVSCFGGNNGSVNATPSGGTPNYSYSWMPGGAVTNSISSLTAGTYTLTITDNNTCQVQNTVTITQPATAVSVSATSTPATCFGGSNGTATATGAGGVGSYTYSWMPGSLSGQNISGLLSLTYTVTVQDNNGCTSTNTILVNQPPAMILTTSTVNSNCGTASGQASVVVSGGVTPYSYLWSPSGGTGTSATALVSGPYTVQVTDANGCIATQFANVNDNAGPTATIFSIIDVTCNGGNDGAASVGVSGGTGPFTYNWTPFGGSATTATGLTAGTYTVTVLDANGCQSNATTSPDILEPPPITLSVTTTEVSCFGGSNGTASVTASGGSPGYTYTWLPSGASGSTTSGLTAGTYTVQVTDTHSCIQTQTFTITQPAAPLNVVNSATPVSCFSGNNGTAGSVASGGTGPYNYSWMPGSITGPAISALTAGTYTVSVTDSKGCTTTGTSVVVQPTALTLVSGSNNAACGTASGLAYVTSSGGTPGYLYSWMPGGTTNDTAAALIPGTYTVSVTDNNSCTTSISVMVNNTPGPVATISSTSNVSCFNGSDGSATVSVSAGVAPYNYSWAATGGTAATASGLMAGTYTVTVTDANGCISPDTAIIIQPTLVVINLVTSNVSCFGGNNGTASVSASGGTPGYIFTWLPSGSTGTSIGGLTAGTYTVQVSDSKGCIQTQTFTITQPVAPLSVATSATAVSCFNGNNGAASAVASGGTGPYNYSWMPGTITGPSISALITGTYTVTVVDVKGCSTTGTSIITQPTPIVLASGSSNAACGTATGYAYVTSSGGTPGYSFSWTPGSAITDTAFALVPGTYSVVVTDNNSCTASTSVAVNNTPGPVATISSTSNVSCFGGSDGSATVTVSAGVPPYNYSWAATGGSAATASGLAAGTYTVTVTDANGCISPDTATITQPTLLVVNVVTTNVSCFGGNNGTATAAGFGGTPGYIFTWLPSGSTGTNISGLSAGTYTVQVADNKGCISTQTFSITQPTLLSPSIASTTSVSCFGGNNGAASVSVAGGSPFYTYNWLPFGGTNDSASGLSAGTYTVNIADANSCTTSITVTITQPAMALSATGTGSVTSCFGGSDGTGIVTPSGGTPSYSYTWAPSGGPGPNASGLPVGTYTILVTDAMGCQTNTSLTVTQPTPIVSSLTTVNPSCGFANGSISSSVSGGTGSYTYFWTPGAATTSSISSVGPGSYTLIINDANACSSTVSATLTNIPGPSVSIASVSSVSCFNGNNGTATASVSSGTPPYTYSWLPSGGSAITGTALSAGNYTVTVTDSLGCMNTAVATVTEPSAVGISVSALTPVSCFGGSNGAITVTGTGGTPAYGYSWAPVIFSSPAISGLTAGSYTVTVTDANSCATSISVAVTEPATLVTSIGSSTNVTCYNGTNGTASASVSGGTIPYTYLWSDGQTGSTAVNLTAGSYTVTVNDFNGCTAMTTATITQPTQVITSAGPNDTICLGSAGSLTSTAAGGAGNYYYVWQPGPSINPGTLNIIPTVSTTYTVVAYDQVGCAGTPDTVSAIVYNLTAANIDAIAYSPICPGQVSAVYAEAYGVTGPLTYSWNNGLGGGPGAYLVTPTAPITYVVTVTNSCGASISDSVDITFNPPPVIVLSTDTNSVCAPSSVLFNDFSITGNTSDPIVTWYWTFGDGTSSNLQDPMHVYPSPGTYPVTLTVTTAGGCTNNNASAPFMIYAHPYPVASFSINSTLLNLPYDYLITNNQSIGATSYVWNFGDGGTSTQTNPQYLYSTVGVYPIMLVATNAYNCSDTAYSEVTTNADVVFPNVFTPSEEGSSGGFYDISSLTNDIFFPYTSGVTDFSLQIFNRWGELIFETTDVKQGWDGYYRGKLCQQDVYVWKASLKLNNGKKFNKTGDVTLLR